jgi:RNA polymerase sigma factor (TIGR02999 family)
MENPGEATVLLRRMRAGEARAADELLPIVYAELHRLARRAMASRPPGHTLQTTALLNEAWLRLAQSQGASWEDREHFLAVAARAMRSVLVDHARRRGALRRSGPGERVDLDRVVTLLEESATDLVALDAALEELAAMNAELARIVELRFFGGLKHPAIATVLDVPLRRVERGWAAARAWLHARVARDVDGEG